MERKQKHLKLQLSLLFTVLISGALFDVIKSYVNHGELTPASFTYFLNILLYIYLPLSIFLFIAYNLFIYGNNIFLKFYYSIWLEFILKSKKNGNKLFNWFVNSFFDELNYELILKSKKTENNKNDLTAFVFNQSWSNKPVFIRREHLLKNGYWPNWSFASVVLLNNKLKLTKRNKLKFVLEIDLQNESYGIYNNAGKSFLKNKFLTDYTKKQFSKKSNRIDEFFLENSEKNYLEIKANKYPIRWASGGVLPIVNWKGSDWFILFFRGIQPNGWGIANGASENKEEYKNINSLMLREFFEELVIADREPFVGDERPLHIKTFDLSNGILKELPKNYRKRIQNLGFIDKHIR